MITKMILIIKEQRNEQYWQKTPKIEQTNRIQGFLPGECQIYSLLGAQQFRWTTTTRIRSTSVVTIAHTIIINDWYIW